MDLFKKRLEKFVKALRPVINNDEWASLVQLAKGKQSPKHLELFYFKFCNGYFSFIYNILQETERKGQNSFRKNMLEQRFIDTLELLNPVLEYFVKHAPIDTKRQLQLPDCNPEVHPIDKINFPTVGAEILKDNPNCSFADAGNILARALRETEESRKKWLKPEQEIDDDLLKIFWPSVVE